MGWLKVKTNHNLISNMVYEAPSSIIILATKASTPPSQGMETILTLEKEIDLEPLAYNAWSATFR
jgi:hypothetical protein